MKEKKLTYVILLTRIVFGLMFLFAGLDKLNSGFTAKGYLLKSVAGPFKDIFISMAGNGFVDILVIWGEILIGIALILGVLVRFTSFWGILMMLLFYLSVLPPQTGYINNQIIYILVFMILATSGSGRFYGLDKKIEDYLYKIGIGKYDRFKLLLG